MPPHQQFLIKRLPIGELPILPFLAPRGSEPWPKHIRSCKARGTALIAASPSIAIGLENRPASTARNGSGIFHAGSRWTVRPRNTEMRSSRPFGFRTASTSTEHAGTYTDEEHFRKATPDIWDLDWTMERSQDEFNLPAEAVKHMSSIEREGRIQPVLRRARRPSYYASISDVRRRVPPVRTQYCRLTTDQIWRRSFVPSLDWVSAIWSFYFPKLSWKSDGQLGRYQIPWGFRIRRVTKSNFFQRTLPNASLEEVRKSWEALTHKERELMWIQVMLVALERRPLWALKFLAVTTGCEPPPPSYAVNDSLECIVFNLLYEAKDPDDKTITPVFQTVIGLLENLRHSYFKLSQNAICCLLQNINTDQAEHLYKGLVHRRHPVHKDTLLYFAYVFGRRGQTQLALDVLQHFHTRGGDFAQPKAESVCSTILERKYRDSSTEVMSDSDIFRLLLDFGLQPNIILCNILLQNAVQSGDSETAWNIHDMMPGLGIEADAHTYSILLNDAKLRMDLPAIQRIMEIVESRGIKNEYIVTDLLHAMFLIYEQERRAAPIGSPPPAPMNRMIPLYAKYFDLEPIRGLLSRGYRDLAVLPDQPKMRPSKVTLVVMFIALLRGFTSATSGPEWYHRFRTMVLSGHPDIMPLAKSSHIYDAIIMCLGRWPVTLSLCTKVISDMFSSYSAAQTAQNRVDLSIRDGEMLQTTMGSPLPLASTRHLSVRGFPRGLVESRAAQEADNIQEGGSATQLAEDISVINEYPSRKSESTEAFPTPSDIAMEYSKESVSQVVLPEHCKPSVYTWSILLQAFMNHSQPRAAEKVLDMMRHRGIMPNHVTWNSLIIGYARLQDIANTVDGIERFENEGWAMDDITIQGLQAIRNREALMEALRKKDLRRTKKQNGTQEAIDRELASDMFGTLNDVVRKELLVADSEETGGS